MATNISVIGTRATITGREFVIGLLTFYTRVVSPALHQLLGIKAVCRYNVTCSVYAKEAIIQNGVLKGGLAAIKRIASCQPFITT